MSDPNSDSHESLLTGERQALLINHHPQFQSAEESKLEKGQQQLQKPAHEVRSLSMWQIVWFASLQAGTSFMFGVSGGWLAYYYVPPEDNGEPQLLNPAVFSIALLVGRIFNGLLEPWIGYYSDHFKSRFGRRKPFIFVAAPLMAITFALMFVMPFEPLSVGASLWFVTFTMLNNFFTACVLAPYISLLPEISNNKADRITIAAAMGVWGMLGNLVTTTVGPIDNALEEGVEIFGYTFSGLQLVCFVMAVVMTVVCWIPLLVVEERPVESEHISSFSLWNEIKVAFSNKAFRTYISMQALSIMSIMMWQVSFPYLCTVVLETETGLVPIGMGETWVGVFSFIILLGALVSTPIISFLGKRFGKKIVLLVAGAVATLGVFLNFFVQYLRDPAVGMVFIMVLEAVSMSALFILPNAVYADVVEQDQQETGKRREGVYTGVRLLLVRFAGGIGTFLVIPLLSIGSSHQDYLGIMLIYIVAGFFMGLGVLIFTMHPIKS